MNSPVLSKNPLIETLNLDFPPNRVVQAFEDALAATSVGKNGCVSPDYRTRLAALQLLISYTEGRPIERQQVETLNHTTDPDADFAMRLKRGPALRNMIRRMLDEAGEVGATT